MKTGKEEGIAAIRLIKILNIRMEEMIDTSMEDCGLTAAQSNVLGFIMDNELDRPNSTDLHRRMHLSKASISVTLKKLREKGFLELRVNPQDDRQKQIAVTEKAWKMKDGIDARFTSLHGCIYRGISGEELVLVTAVLRKMLDNLKEEENKT